MKQTDSLETNVAFDLEREGKIIRSFRSSRWNHLSASDIPGIQNGDVVRFDLTGSDADSVWGYEEVSYVGMTTPGNDSANVASEDIPAPTMYGIGQSYPNPFNPTTTINYQLPVDGYVTLKVYDVLGREVKTLVNGQLPVGRYTATLDGSQLATGVYFYRINIHGTDGKTFVSTKKALLMK